MSDTDTERALRDLLTEIRHEMDDRYDGAPDSRSLWMGPLLRDIDAILARAEGEPLPELRYEAHVLDRMADHIWGMFARRLKPDSVPPPEMDRGVWRDEMRKLAAMVCDSIATSALAPDASPEGP